MRVLYVIMAADAKGSTKVVYKMNYELLSLLFICLKTRFIQQSYIYGKV